jgi:hypothetical protein
LALSRGTCESPYINREGRMRGRRGCRQMHRLRFTFLPGG